MTHFETARIKELIGLQIGAIQEVARELDADGDIEEIEAGIAALEKTIAALKGSLEAIPHEHR
jgi:hypothetical protein